MGEFSRNGKSRGKQAEKAIDHDMGCAEKNPENSENLVNPDSNKKRVKNYFFFQFFFALFFCLNHNSHHSQFSG